MPPQVPKYDAQFDHAICQFLSRSLQGLKHLEHFPNKHVTGQAVDIVPYPVDWEDLSKFDATAKAMFAAAKELGVSIRWGADWDNDGKLREQGEYDSPHFELV